MHRSLILLLIATTASAQAQNCDSVVATSRVDSVASGIFVTVRSFDRELLPSEATSIALNVGAAFVPPRPLKLSVFGASPALRVLRASSDTAASLRAPNITGVYEVTVGGEDSIPRVRVARTSLITGFDSAAIAAIRSAGAVPGLFHNDGGYTLGKYLVRFATDSLAGARRIISGSFPRMPVVDAIPVDTNPRFAFPDSARALGLTQGNAVLRFIVGRDGVPEPGTTEVVRATDGIFVREAVIALPKHRFRPATIRGCPVAQLVDYAFSFFLPEPPR